jgi:hypothetical protein
MIRNVSFGAPKDDKLLSQPADIIVRNSSANYHLITDPPRRPKPLGDAHSLQRA